MIKVAILGLGTVGSGVAELIEKNARAIAARAGDAIEIKHILEVRDLTGSPFEKKHIRDFSVIENDPEVRIVVETIGGTDDALDFTRRSLTAGKHVVTSNKALVAHHGAGLLKLAWERNVSYLFEASVGGGIPIIRPLVRCLAANRFEGVYGILNGTTNYILTRMVKGGLSFENALREAQQKGYAEKNPEADIEGRDACRKLCILSSLMFGRHFAPESVPTEGIMGIGPEDVAYAQYCGRAVKLIGRARLRCDGKVNIFVAPHLISRENPLASVEDVYNGIVIQADAAGEVMFCGRGAGKLPTASAVVADIIDISNHVDAQKKRPLWEEGGESLSAGCEGLTTRYYIRAAGEGLRADVHEIFGGVEWLSKAGAPAGEAAFLTPNDREETLCQQTRALSEKHRVASRIHVLD